MHKTLSLKHALLAAVILSLPIAAQAGSRPDAWITMKAKTALYLAKDVTGTAINVDTINGRVTLHGTVRDGKEKARAVEVVNAIEGVSDVKDLLHVASHTQNATMMKRSDDLIKSDVQKRLKAARSLDDSSISVKSVDDGVVLLTGRAASYDDHQRALYYAAGQPGVLRVASEIDVPDTLPDVDFRAEEEMMPETGKRNIGGVTSDLWITSATKMRLAADSRTPATEINVDSHDGIVTLFGMVPSQESKSAAAEIARGVSGVKRVENRLEVVASTNHDLVQARDEEIQQGVEKSLNDRGAQENADIDVEVTNGVVRLTGTVSTWQSNLSAVYLARSVTGVRSVLSELKVETRNASRS
ncbi:MAG TPA: BON domain-containing protein [Candidatus Polarisedimenticolia bacterium]|jgi:hyperosmotically inducible protein|nr:BON domain-containing protein [Candidatus Polarisedimenticolia bacterium]